ncbi:hypothetical protein SNE40_017799 [Patella caerulea]|uniref:galactosylceramidase n=1 Tax=Patella caerulea TaxID=87958 RepID=A0AAN8JF17_PATCE
MGVLIKLLVLHLCCIYGINGGSYKVDNSVGYGRTFDGIGAISGGGATSKLLINYPTEQRSQILDYLFKPNFGASLQIFKVEIGGDIQSTDGTEASHMHNSWDENYNRGYEWWMMKEAKMRNPDIKLYGLPWGFPGFLKDAYDRPWGNIQSTADYVVKWVNGARVYHNLTMDYIGIWNESPYNITYIKTLRKTLDNAGFNRTKIIASDNNWDIVGDMIKDAELNNVIFGVGSHYPGTNSTPEAASLNKPLWASEDWSCVDPLVGPGCLARTLNQNYVNGYMTSTIIWNIISSYYYGLPWYNSGIMTASEPWSGHYIVPQNIWVTAHTTQFTSIGWKYLKHGYGVGKLNGGGSYVVLISPDEQDLTIIIETLSHDSSICTRPPLAPYNVVAGQTATFELAGILKQRFTSLNTWYSRIGYYKFPSVSFKNRGPLTIQDGSLSVQLGKDEVWTLSTVKSGFKGSFPSVPGSKRFPLPYIEDFEGYKVGEEPFNLAQQVGSFEVDQINNVKFMKQVVLETPVHWFYCLIGTYNTSLNVIGDYTWQDIRADVAVKLDGENTTDSVYLSVRTTACGCQADIESGLFLFFFPKEQRYLLSSDLLRKNILVSGKVPTVTHDWDVIKLQAKGDHVWGAVNNDMLFNISIPVSISHGWVAVGTYPFGTAYFDDLHINPV